MHPPLQALVIMGVAGCGKSSVSQALCQRSGAHGIEGDSFHPAANIRKMSAGIPLTDDDRAGWLDTLAEQLRQAVAAGKLPVLTCSALKRAYQEFQARGLRARVLSAAFRNVLQWSELVGGDLCGEPTGDDAHGREEGK